MLVVAGYAAIASCLLIVVAAATGPGDPLPGSEGLGWIQGWARWDSGWYRDIATDGYFFTPGEQSSVAFFPSYPLLLWAGSELLPVFLVGYVITVLSGLASSLLFFQWCSGRMSRAGALAAVAVLMLYPYSFFLFGAVYADAFFLACALGAFLLLERGHPVLAGLAGMAATAGRPVGIAVLVGLAVRAVELAGDRRPTTGSRPRGRLSEVGGHLRQVTWRDSAVLLSGAGLASYCCYLWIRFGDPLAFVATESAPGWQEGSGIRIWLKFSFFEKLSERGPLAVAHLAVPALAGLVVLLLLPRIRQRFGWGYTVYTAIAVAMPLLGTRDFLGMGRYLIVAFPAAAVLGELLTTTRAPRLKTAYFATSAVGLISCTAAYGAGYLIS